MESTPPSVTCIKNTKRKKKQFLAYGFVILLILWQCILLLLGVEHGWLPVVCLLRWMMIFSFFAYATLLPISEKSPQLESIFDFTLLGLIYGVTFGWVEFQADQRKISLLASMSNSWFRAFLPCIGLLLGGNWIGLTFSCVNLTCWLRAAYLSPMEPTFPVVFFEQLLVICLILYYNRIMDTIYLKLQVLYETAEKANQTKTEFMAKMSHDLRTPLNGLLGFLSQAMENPENMSSTCYESLRVVQLCAFNLERIICDLLDVSLIELGRTNLANVEFDLQRDLNTLTSLIKKMGEKKQLSLDVKISDCIPKLVKGDSVRIQQVIINLVNNAFKFTPDGGHVEVEIDGRSCSEGKFQLKFRVSDTGIGIPNYCMDRLYNRFFQCREEDSSKGSGLGLYICHQLVTSMEGRILCCSEPNKGTTFSGYVMLERVSGNQTPHSDVQNIHFKHTKVLVVEDNPINMRLMSKLLESHGIKIFTAENGKQAVDLYPKIKDEISLILMDIQMPVMDGIEATAHIRQMDNERRIPIIAVTAGVMEEEIDSLIKAGMDSYVPKPVKKERLFQALQKWSKEHIKYTHEAKRAL